MDLDTSNVFNLSCRYQAFTWSFMDNATAANLGRRLRTSEAHICRLTVDASLWKNE